MNYLIPVEKDEQGNVVVSGRELHDFLEINTPYTQWFERMVGYGFDENVDFIGLSQKSEKPIGGRPQQDHALTLDMAKEISMIQRTERGKQARQYFLEIEKRYKQQLPQTPEERLALTMQVANRLNNRMMKVEDEIDYIKNKSEIDSTQRYKLKAARNRKAVEICGGHESNFYKTKNAPRKVFRELEHDLKEVFVISRYEDLKKEDFDRAVSFINNWHASYPLEQEIARINAQTRLEV
ncbi:antA/AntB antirepressor family protein [Ligilactobacillus animalis]|uniref:antA/AntB antirepressor family protein n=1 Tax=Ligilactobacillus animalis TaxID=1605 RepID=UPI0029036C7C|nr:ORF6C domain-containing protein [Ligilactobacillus animalis]MDU1488424.1 ORF6C domain-containing protein [Ligilactobacillus animalis]